MMDKENFSMSTLRRLTVELELGQTILVGPNRQPTKITKIEFHEKTGEIHINTTRGPRSALTFSLLSEDSPTSITDVADKYR
jgi:hypothetical protein